MQTISTCRRASTCAVLVASLLSPLPADAGGLPDAGAPAIVVTSESDPGDGVLDDGSVTIREAIELANRRPGLDVVEFSLAGPGPHAIVLERPLPPIADPISLDGFAGPGVYLTPDVVLDGGAIADPSHGLEVVSGESLVRGLAIVRFPGHGIVLRGRGGNRVESCHVGVEADGVTAAGNALGGILVETSRNLIGGAGDLTPLPRNLVGANGSHGIEIAGGGRNRISANLIGLGPGLANAGCGVLVSAGAQNVVGGFEKGDGNVIAGNGDAGVRVLSGAQNLVALNLVVGNAGLPIDIGPAGPTPNDPGDADRGANELQNAPTLRRAVAGALGAVVEGSLESAASTTYRIEIFVGPACGNAASLERVVEVTTDANGIARFRAVLYGVGAGKLVAATTTDPLGNTSEFGPCVQVRSSRT
jgi:hypothetical protein